MRPSKSVELKRIDGGWFQTQFNITSTRAYKPPDMEKKKNEGYDQDQAGSQRHGRM